MTIIVFLFILGVLIIVHEFGHFIIAKKIGVRVEKFSLGFGPRLLKRKKGETEYSVSLIPLGGFVKLAGDTLEEYKGADYEYLSKPPGKRFWVIVFGSLLNYILGFLIFGLIFFLGHPSLTTKVETLMEGFGAKEAGLQAGDKILEIDDKRITFWEELQNVVQSKKINTKVKLLVLRDNRKFTVDVLIKEKELEDDKGQKHAIGLLGISPQIEIAKGNFIRSFVFGINKTLNLTVFTYKGLWHIITGKVSVRESATGPLGIFFITSKVAHAGIIAILDWIALLSISLAIFNLLPFPVLDGGHILFLGLEKIRGKALSIKTEQVIAQIGVTVIISLALFITYNDFLRFFQDKIANFLNK